MTLRDKIVWHFHQLLKHHFPFIWSRHLSKSRLGKSSFFLRPRNLNDKIQWMMFYTEHREWSTLADKYAVRDYVKERIGQSYLVPLLGSWQKAEDIDFDKLPNEFVIRPNNGSYDTVICRDKRSANLESIRTKMAKALSQKFGFENAEWHYLKIPPRIVAEQLIHSDSPGGLIDYKIWCFDGKPHLIFVCANRDNSTHHLDFVCYNTDWQIMPDFISERFRNDFTCPRPKKLEEMLSVAEKLSEGHPQARIDLYHVADKVYFGEITLSSNFGMMPYFSESALEEMGVLVKLPTRSVREKVTTFCSRWLPQF